MRIEGEYFRLESGRQIYANKLILGLGDFEDGEGVSLTYGYDGPVDTDDFTYSEKCEIAQYMIEKWALWARMELPRWPG